MNVKSVRLVLVLAILACGCRDAQNHQKMRRLTVDLLRSVSDAGNQLASEEDSLKYMDAMGKSVVSQRAVIESASKRLASLRADIHKYSDVEHPTINQIRYEKLNHQKLLDELKKIMDDHDKGIKRAKEQVVP